MIVSGTPPKHKKNTNLSSGMLSGSSWCFHPSTTDKDDGLQYYTA